jgi:outer membrane biosynthesis protein TonB
MLPQSQPRRKRNSSKVNLLISFIFHAALVVVLLYFAARSGILGNQIKKIAVQMIKEKAPPKPKPPPPHVEPPKVEAPKVSVPKPVEEAKAPVTAPPTVAPPAAQLPSFDFDGGRAVSTSSDPVQLYKGALEYAFRSKWDRPDNIDDVKFVAEVRVSVDRDGNITNPQWEEGSGNTIWDQSVRKAIAAVTSMDHSPPTNFPPQITVRFDVQDEAEDDSLMQ